ncbi:MAG: DNA N-6-adenine-methyltransferase [Planktothrix sp.]
MVSHSCDVQTSKKSDEHYTPRHIVQLALDFFGEIDLDPASNSKESPNVPAKEVFTSWDDGLTKSWGPTSKKVWLNPPYSQNRQWAAKVVSEYQEGHIKEIILLLPVRLGVGWFKTYLRLNPIILPIEGRLDFTNSNSLEEPKEAMEEVNNGALFDVNPFVVPKSKPRKKESAPFESMLLYVGDNPQGFLDCFEVVASTVLVSCRNTGKVFEVLGLTT